LFAGCFGGACVVWLHVADFPPEPENGRFDVGEGTAYDNSLREAIRQLYRSRARDMRRQLVGADLEDWYDGGARQFRKVRG
jgi:hypothetical protein